MVLFPSELSTEGMPFLAALDEARFATNPMQQRIKGPDERENAPQVPDALSTPAAAQPAFQKYNQSRNQHTRSFLTVITFRKFIITFSDAPFVTMLLRSYVLPAILDSKHTPAWLITREGGTISPPRAGSMSRDTFAADLASSLSPHSQVQAGPAAKRTVSPASAVSSDCWTNHTRLTDSCLLLTSALPTLTGDFAASQPADFNKKAESS